MNKLNAPNNTATAVRTNEGFIEITSLELLDEMVGGMINPDTVFCHIEEDEVPKNYSIDAGV